MRAIESQAVEASQTMDSPESRESFNHLIAQIQLQGEPIVEQADTTNQLAQIGLMAVRAATLCESNHLEDCRDEVYDILTALGNTAESNPELAPILQQLEEIYKNLNEAKS